MRYVIINELYRMGGSEVQSLRELKTMAEHGHEVLYITFDSAFSDGWDKDNKSHINFVTQNSGIKKRVCRAIVDAELYDRLRSILADFTPDYIHVNNATDHAPVIYKAVGAYRTFQTIRDYGAVCPTALCVDKDYRVCEGKKAHCCTIKCLPKNNRAMFLYYNAVTGITSRLRKRNIKQFVCPSQRLTQYCNEHGLPTICVNNPFDFGFLDGFQKNLDREKKIYLFYGFVAEHKGIRQLLTAFEAFSKGKNCELLIAGKITDDMSTEVTNHGDNIHYIGVKPYNEIIRLLERVYAVVVPSLWMENYPNTVLEGLCTECLVLASDRGGMKEMIRDDRFIFNVLDQQDIINKLTFSYELTMAEHNEIVKENLRYVKQNNSTETYYTRVIKVLQMLDDVRGKCKDAKYKNTSVDARNFLGGAERQFRFLIENANAHNASVVLLNMHLHNAKITDESVRFIKNSDVNYYEITPRAEVGTLIGRLGYALRVNKLICAILEQHKIDAAIVYEPQGCYSIPFMKRKHIKIIYSERNSGEGVVNGHLIKSLIKKADIITCNSSSAKAILENGLKRTVTQINNGIEIDTQNPVPEKEGVTRTTVLVPARIAPIKNQLIVVEMLHIMDDRSNYKVIFAGKTEDSEYEDLLKEKVIKYGLESVCEFPGYISDMDEVYNQADVVILPSLAEGMSNVVLECFARKKLIICSDIPMNCVNAEVRRFAFDPNDPRDLRDKLDSVRELLHEEKEEYLKTNYDFVCREYSIDKMVESYIRLVK